MNGRITQVRSESRGASDPPLPEGYNVKWDNDFLKLLRPNGSEAAIFTEHGAHEEIMRSAWEDLRNG